MRSLLKLLAGFFSLVLVVGILASDKHEDTPGSVETRTPATTQKKRAGRTKGTGRCLNASTGLPDQSFRVLSRIDKTHYKLRNEGNTKDQSYIVLETQRELTVGDSTHLEEVTELGLKGDWSKLEIRWREGCSEKARGQADFSQGTWWTPIDPSNPGGPPCVKAVTRKYNLAPITLIQASNGGCVIEQGSDAYDLMFLDCTNSALGTKVAYARTRESCLKYVSLVKAYQQSAQGGPDE